MLYERINTVVIDEKPTTRQELVDYLLYNFPQVRLLGSGKADSKTWEVVKQQNPDLIFWDVDPLLHYEAELPAHFGEIPAFEIIIVGTEQLTARNITSPLSYDFLTKPIEQRRLWEIIRRVQEKQQMSRLLKQVNTLTNLLNSFLHPVVELPTMQGFDLILVDRIIYCEAHNNYTKLILINQKPLLVTKNLKDIEAALHPHPFVRIHKQHLIHLRYMNRYMKGDGGQVIMHDGTVLNVSRSRKDTLIEACRGFHP